MLPRPLGTLIVLPAFNEEASVGAVLAEIRRVLPGTPCLVVDDGSTDATAERAAAGGATVLRLPFNLGVGGAMRAGFRYALAEGFHTVVQLDADGQHDPAEVPELLAALDDGTDIAIGARFAGKGAYEARGPRRWAMLVLSGVISRISRTKLTDTTSGFKANGPRAIALFAEHFPAEYLGDTVEALVIAARAGLRIRQVPVAMRPRQGGAPSHRPLKAAVYLIRAFVALGFALVRPRVVLETGGAR
ncbi:glycosyltransferase family 2 protein [Agromyces sp. M3QZ16-3]|uniref:glycosyltransferase family 2 protein n=1 Tax=Agromyces sp. M3QZ16-3 TaxID=3447585 RepID=UPI003F690737